MNDTARPRGPVEEIAALGRLVHEPARLAVLTALSACASADFPYLARITGLTNGNLASHLARLEAANLLTVKKSFRGRTPTTRVSITTSGRRAVEEHWDRLDQLRQQAVHFMVADGALKPT